MTDTSKAGRVIFIGNIPYGLTEEQIVHTFSSVGQVLNFRLVYDQDTGRPKGFGFAEFADTDSAASAVRNLNGYEIMGRELRVDFSHVGGKESDANANTTTQAPPPQQAPPNGYPPQPSSTSLPPLPPGVDLPPNLTCPDAISKTLSSLSPPQLLDILSQMKGLVMGDPARATELLSQAPHLSYAIFQALLLMGLVDTSVLASVVETQSTQGAVPPPQPQIVQQIPHMPPQPAPSYQQPPPQQQQPPPPPHQAQPYPQYPQLAGQMNVPTPPLHGQNYQPPPMPQPPPPQQQQQQQQAPPPPPPPQAQNTQHEQLLKQVMAMTQQQIDSLPPTERGQIMALRQQLTGRY